ncbi:MAG TPA: NADH-quinone oxidoreductase subunit B family protein [Candidatus Sulfotelmatobacter sp.]|nr:NADH-quinone oxidoreductase subunit B family protein [Candidatus Sulfotelmatobacter sp.]
MTSLPPPAGSAPGEVAALSEDIRVRVRRLFRGSFHLRHVDAGSCNGCEAELRALLNPFYDLHRLGIFMATSPRHADGLLVTGPITAAMREPLLRTYEAMPDPKLVIAVGACACTGGVFTASPLVAGPLDAVLPVDAYIPGCPPSPLTLLHGLLLALDRAEERV